MKGTKGSYKEKGFTMDENMVQNETMDDVVETDAEIIEDADEGGINPLIVVGGTLTALGVAAFTQRKKIAAWYEQKKIEHLKKQCDKHGINYVVVEPVPNETDTEN